MSPQASHKYLFGEWPKFDGEPDFSGSIIAKNPN